MIVLSTAACTAVKNKIKNRKLKNTTQPIFCPTQHQNFFMKNGRTQAQRETSESEISQKVIIILKFY